MADGIGQPYVNERVIVRVLDYELTGSFNLDRIGDRIGCPLIWRRSAHETDSMASYGCVGVTPLLWLYSGPTQRPFQVPGLARVPLFLSVIFTGASIVLRSCHLTRC